MPVGAQEEDYSAIKIEVDRLTSTGVDNLADYFLNNPRILRDLIIDATVLNVNQALLDIHGADSKETFLNAENGIEDWWNDGWARFYATEIDHLAKGNPYFGADALLKRVEDFQYTWNE